MSIFQLFPSDCITLYNVYIFAMFTFIYKYFHMLILQIKIFLYCFWFFSPFPNRADVKKNHNPRSAKSLGLPPKIVIFFMSSPKLLWTFNTYVVGIKKKILSVQEFLKWNLKTFKQFFNTLRLGAKRLAGCPLNCWCIGYSKTLIMFCLLLNLQEISIKNPLLSPKSVVKSVCIPWFHILK